MVIRVVESFTTFYTSYIDYYIHERILQIRFTRLRVFVILATLILILCIATLLPSMNAEYDAKFKTPQTPARPNIVFILTDDQDDVMGSLSAMPNLQKYVLSRGLRFTNSYVSTPLCCPSRSAIATGRYGHNTGAFGNRENCSSQDFIDNEIPRTWIRLLQSSGYRTFFSGKYIHRVTAAKMFDPDSDQMENHDAEPVTIPPGWDWFNRWKQGIGRTYYYDYVFFVNETVLQFGSDPKHYLTTVIENSAIDFLRFSAVDDKPFFMMVAPTAPHSPAIYEDQFSEFFQDVNADRSPSYGKYCANKHWIVSFMQKELPKATTRRIDKVFRNRWRVLKSVDNMILRILNQLERIHKLDNTIIAFSSDNGYHAGQFNLPYGKRMAYEFDIRVPLIFMGPNIPQNEVRRDLVQNIDLGPTFLELAGVQDPRGTWHDGRSIAPLLTPYKWIYDLASKNWRKMLLVEYVGEWKDIDNYKCNYSNDSKVMGCYLPGCKCMDAKNNTYHCLRHFDGGEINEIYCEYDDDVQFREYYQLNKDPWQLDNSFETLAQGKKVYLKNQLKALKSCRGDSCWAMG